MNDTTYRHSSIWRPDHDGHMTGAPHRVGLRGPTNTSLVVWDFVIINCPDQCYYFIYLLSIYLFISYVTTSAAETILCRIVGWVVNHELERIWKQPIVSLFEVWNLPVVTEEKALKISVRIDSFRAETWTWNLLTTKQECYPLDGNVLWRCSWMTPLQISFINECSQCRFLLKIP